MSRISRLWSWLCIDAAQPDIALAQLRELRLQIPLLYSLLMVNAVAVAYTHYGLAPFVLTVVVPGVIFFVCILRLIAWLLHHNRPVTAERAVNILRRTTALAALLSAAYISWSLTLDQYGGPYEHGHVALFIAITVIGCIFCLMHLPQAALAVTGVVTVPYLVYYLQMDNTVFRAVAMNILLVTAVMIQVLLNSFNGFTKMVRSQGALAAKQIETARLGGENARLAHTDSLTNLPNRRFFFAQMEQWIEECTAAKTQFSVGVLDLDRFKPVNDTYGHVFGDRLLEDVGLRLAEIAGPNVVVARLGGDEFGFISLSPGEEARRLGQRMCDALGEPFAFDEISVAIGCSCGLAVFPDAGTTAHELFDRSDYALYNSKSARLGSATLYSLEHETQIRSERAIEAALQIADLEAEMEIHFQPIVDIRTATVAAVEALARWTSPSLGAVRPDVFISIAEKAGLIHKLTLALFQKSLIGMQRLAPDTKLSFNLSAQDVTCPQTVLALVGIIRQAKIAPERIVLELTETAVMRNFELALSSIRLLRSLGVQIALDDFGTGYSSLGYIHRLPIDKVKIDRSFVLELGQSSGHNIIGSILGLCRNLSVECVVEGVETTQQRDILEAMGCSVFQGYLFARPMPTEALLEWLAAPRHWGGTSRSTAQDEPAENAALCA